MDWEAIKDGSVMALSFAAAVTFAAVMATGPDHAVTTGECEQIGGIVVVLQSAEVPRVVCLHGGKYWPVDVRAGR